METSQFQQSISQGYACQGPAILLGTAMLEGSPIPQTPITIPLKSINRHGLIAGATGTGKTKTVQLLTELLSKQGIPSLLMDLKGDLSGLAAAGTPHPKIDDRMKTIDSSWQPQAFPVTLLSISQQPGVQLRSTLNNFGPILLSQLLDLNDTQAGILSVVFKYCEDQQLPLIDLADLKAVLNYLSNDGKAEIEKNYGHFSTVSTGALIRKLLELEQQQADLFFGEPAFDVNDLLQKNSANQGSINILRLNDLTDRPKLFATFMLNLLNDVYRTFPEIGDPEKPKLVMIIDEGHLIFNHASKAVLNTIETIIKLIRSKGVGIIFCTQNPTDIPASVLSQLGLKIQHALRAFTAKDRKAIKLTAENYPISEYYNTVDIITALGIGEALVTALDERGRPTPLAVTLLQAPSSRMAPLTDSEVIALSHQSSLVAKYRQRINRKTAYEQLQQRNKKSSQKVSSDRENRKKTTKKNNESLPSQLGKSKLVRQLLNTFVREVTRAVLRMLGIKNKRR